MRVFISYSSAYGDTAESLAIRLGEDGHETFFDRHALKAAEEFDAGIRREVDRADLFVFLITPEAVRDGAYTRTELEFAQKRWPQPSGRVLPVMLRPTAIGDVPPYARAVTILQTQGNLVAEVAARVDEISRARRRNRILTILSAAAVLLLLGVIAYPLIKGHLPVAPDRDLVETCYLQVRLRAADSAFLATTLRVGGNGISQDFAVAAGGAANIHVKGDQMPAWEVTVIDRDGYTLGVVPLSGCPGSAISQVLNDRLQFELGPRDVSP